MRLRKCRCAHFAAPLVVPVCALKFGRHVWRPPTAGQGHRPGELHTRVPQRPGCLRRTRASLRRLPQGRTAGRQQRCLRRRVCCASDVLLCRCEAGPTGHCAGRVSKCAHQTSAPATAHTPVVLVPTAASAVFLLWHSMTTEGQLLAAATWGGGHNVGLLLPTSCSAPGTRLPRPVVKAAG